MCNLKPLFRNNKGSPVSFPFDKAWEKPPGTTLLLILMKLVPQKGIGGGSFHTSVSLKMCTPFVGILGRSVLPNFINSAGKVVVFSPSELSWMCAAGGLKLGVSDFWWVVLGEQSE